MSGRTYLGKEGREVRVDHLAFRSSGCLVGGHTDCRFRGTGEKSDEITGGADRENEPSISDTL